MNKTFPISIVLITLLITETTAMSFGLLLLSVPVLGVYILLLKLSMGKSYFMRIVSLVLSCCFAAVGYLLLFDIGFIYFFISCVPFLTGIYFVAFFRKDSLYK